MYFYLSSGAFYPGAPGFDGPAAYIPPPPYSASVAQAPLDPDLPPTSAGQNRNHNSISYLEADDLQYGCIDWVALLLDIRLNFRPELSSVVHQVSQGP